MPKCPCVLLRLNFVCCNPRLVVVLIFTERDHKKTGQPETTQQPFPRDGKVPTGEDCSCPYRHRVNQVQRANIDPVSRLGIFSFPSLIVRLPSWFFFHSALIKQVNKSIEGTADDDDEGVPTEQAIRAGLELLKVSMDSVLHDGEAEIILLHACYYFLTNISGV